jgi:heterodisulfide reductase subunit B
MTKYIFYPGCSLEGTASPYYDSIKAIQDKISVEIEEVKDWNCCGATEYQAVERVAGHAIVGRNLAIAQSQVDGADTLTAPCSACYLNLSKTDHYMATDPDLRDQVNDALSAGGLSYDPGSVQIRHFLDVVFNDVGVEKIKSLVTKPLKGLRLAAYYGCMITRPDVNHRFSSHEYPTALEELLEALGAEVIDFPLKTHCCSGHMTQISSDTALELIRRLLDGAAKYEADMLVTLCPMCQMNIDAFQNEVNKTFKTDFEIPIAYFTQVMGLAFGFTPKELGFGKEFIDAKPAIAKIGAEAPEEGKKPKKKKEEGLPMPQMPGQSAGGAE